MLIIIYCVELDIVLYYYTSQLHAWNYETLIHGSYESMPNYKVKHVALHFGTVPQALLNQHTNPMTCAQLCSLD